MKIWYLLLVGLSLIVACGNPPEPPPPPPSDITVSLIVDNPDPFEGSSVKFTVTGLPANKIEKLELLENDVVKTIVNKAATLEQSLQMDVIGKRSFTARATDAAGVEVSSAVVEVNTKAIIAAIGVVQVAMGSRHTCALLNNSDVRCWGGNNNGRLGLGNKLDIGDDEAITSVEPIKFPTGFQVKQLAAGLFHTCALSERGQVICWGRNQAGQLGYGDTIDRGDTPETTPDKLDFVGLPPVQSIVSGDSANHTCAILVSGVVRCWGENNFGQLGLGNKNNNGDSPDELETTPAINLGISPVQQIAVNGGHTCALRVNSTLHCWGKNGDGQLGYGNIANFGDNIGETPNTKIVPIADAAQIALGVSHTCVVTVDKKVRCWGLNGFGQLGYGNTNVVGDNEFPAEAGFIDSITDFQQLSLGFEHSCALLENDSIKCWGSSFSGQLGYGNSNSIGDDELPSEVDAVRVNIDTTQGKVIRVFSGTFHNCVLFESGNIKCWGSNFSGELGQGNKTSIGDDEFPSSVGVVPLF
jgi:alpha-tubulin suppressor-like RCC1 family protein